ncbi:MULTISPECIES: hypothetical protein [Pasteurellaceae]|uniref:Uncharacterized protein n=1 Tax=Pasteurella atlantica TaxID=2827233 RepID=A0AAW8CQ17_9PAST|nr:hypothetical protein [Pasteurella atlantica]MDP8040106.1 hypothetical protein [Pasteurella atlantica]MDP8042219.1 hypothetical protein [Pasteurella atlantica]MDP8044374.1 hypothetical protein [Pasteurella atlantica]MDP8046378.1 hypothetical protein [Pasteurella atlantica]MDP8062221.1 hypothetical protein [Pasteurella atlantica]
MGKLNFGLSFNGKIHKDFSVKLLTVGGNCKAQEVLADLGIEPESESLRDRTIVDMAHLVEQVDISGIPKSALTVDFMLENLVDEDYWLILEALVELRKKRLGDMVIQTTSVSLTEPHIHKTE